VARPERKRAPARKRLTEVGSAPPSNQEQTLPQPPAIVAKGPAVVVEQLPEAKPDPASAPGPGTAGVDASGAEAPAAAGSDEPKVIRLDKFRKK
jgi:hypothetical protein